MQNRTDEQQNCDLTKWVGEGLSILNTERYVQRESNVSGGGALSYCDLSGLFYAQTRKLLRLRRNSGLERQQVSNTDRHTWTWVGEVI
jgi:hypothetical protein